MMTEQITENAKAILLLCGRFGGGDDNVAKPLTTKEYDELAAWLRARNWWPVDLLEESNLKELKDPALSIQQDRLKTLLDRGAVMALSVEKWINKGLWVLCRSDEDYPQKLKQNLKRNAPPIIYGAGERMLLSKGGLAVVGSRNVDAQGETFARDLGRRAAECGMQLISGAARGVDETAMHGAFSAGGTVVGVLADSLLAAAVSSKYREGLREGQLTLISTYNPEAPFSVGSAMGRNKYVYALADFSVVVSTDHKKGGTWAGAEEELKDKDHRPLFVRITPETPPGNAALLKMGAIRFPEEGLKEDLPEVLLRTSAGQTIAAQQEEATLFTSEKEHLVSAEGVRRDSAVRESTAEYGSKTPANSASIYDAVKPLILDALRKSLTVDELAEILRVRKPQLQDWIKAMIKEGVVKKKTILKKKRLVRVNPDEELSL